MEEFLWCKLFWRRKTKHDLQMLSRKCFFPKAARRAEHVSVCEDCLVAVRGCEREGHGDSVPGTCPRAPPRCSAVMLSGPQHCHLEILKIQEMKSIVQETKFLHPCLSSYVDRKTLGYQETPWPSSPKSYLFVDGLLNSLKRGNVWIITISVSSQALFEWIYWVGNGIGALVLFSHGTYR